MIENKNIGELILKQGSWLEPNIDDAPIISSRIRLARNLDDYHFPGWLQKIKVVLYGSNHVIYLISYFKIF